MSLKKTLFNAFESLLRVPPLLIVDEILRISFGITQPITKFGDKTWSSIAKSSSTEQFIEIVTQPTSNLEPSSSHSYEDERLFSFASLLFKLFDQGKYFLLTSSYGASTLSVEDNSTLDNYIYRLEISQFINFEEPITADLIRTAEVLSCFAVFFSSLIIFSLSTTNLMKLYSFLLSFFSLYLVYIMQPFNLTEEPIVLSSILWNLVGRIILAIVYFVTRSWPGSTEESKISYLSSMLDSCILTIFFATGVVYFDPPLFIIFVGVAQNSFWLSLPKMFIFLRDSWRETRRVQNDFGLSHLLHTESGRLRINTVFRFFWISRATYDAVFRCCDEPVTLILRHVMTRGTETFTGIVGLTVTVSALCHQIGEVILWFLYCGAITETDMNRFGSIASVLFFILSLQSGLTGMDPDKRLDRLLKNLVLLATALFHALHQMLSPILHVFRSFQALQIRAVFLSFVFLLISTFSTFFILKNSNISTWSLAVLALAIEFKIKIIISLIISFVVYLSQLVNYPETFINFGRRIRNIIPSWSIDLYDKCYDQLSHEDIVFYLKSVAHICEFLTGIFLFVNAMWIFIFESASSIRALGMSIHAYFNIWCEARKGFKIYTQRMTASMKIISLSDATQEQLNEKKDDVCAICYEEMDSAKVTQCGHLFHAVCLRKWLYVQNTCPLCHEVLYGDRNLEEDHFENVLGIPELNNLPIPPEPQHLAQNENDENLNSRAESIQNIHMDFCIAQNNNLEILEGESDLTVDSGTDDEVDPLVVLL